jgi:hypothetical protein
MPKRPVFEILLSHQHVTQTHVTHVIHTSLTHVHTSLYTHTPPVSNFCMYSISNFTSLADDTSSKGNEAAAAVRAVQRARRAWRQHQPRERDARTDVAGWHVVLWRRFPFWLSRQLPLWLHVSCIWRSHSLGTWRFGSGSAWHLSAASDSDAKRRILLHSHVSMPGDARSCDSVGNCVQHDALHC